ncbi:MAG: PSD1 and planctomycete cytochrome C domain-containing protein [Kiritimatiellia bacterium]
MNRTALLLLFLTAPQVRAAPDGPVRFNRDIRPILSGNCIFCHGPDASHRKAKLRLDLRDAALAAKAFTPGKPEESELVKRLRPHDEKDLMPPPESKKTLTEKEKDLLTRWIAEGANYEPHWAYTPLKRPEVPGAAAAPVDAFIAKALAERGRNMSPEAGRRELLRRLSLDLTGLPPTPEEVAAFVADTAPDAYAKQVERLLASPHFGERMASWWLDVARFADTVGYHGDQNQRVFPYRDYVINAFNTNKRFDRFTTEQLAGDLLPGATDEQRVATGFNRLNMMTREGGAQPGEYLAKYAADRVRTVSAAFLGSTMGCAECHDHKYDPFTTRDFYSLSAFFADVKQWGVYADYGYTPNPDLRGYNNESPFPPEIEVDSPYLRERMARIDRDIDALAPPAAAAAAPGALAAWEAETLAFLKAHPDGWSAPTPALPNAVAGTVTNVAAAADGTMRIANWDNKQDLRVELAPGAGWIAAVRLEALPHPADGGRIVRGNAGGSTLQLSLLVKRADGKEEKVAVLFADSHTKMPQYNGGEDVPGLPGGWRLAAARLTERQEAVWTLERPVQLAADDRLVLLVRPDQAGALRASVTPVSKGFALERPDPAALRAALETAPAARTPEQKTLAARAWMCGTGAGDQAAFKALHNAWVECRYGRAHTLVTEARAPAVTRILPRGNWQDESGDVVAPATPAFLPAPKKAAKPLPPVAPVEIVWMEDELPAGGDRVGDGPTTFITSDAGPVFSGKNSLKRSSPGRSQDVYLNGPATYTLPDKPRLFAYVRLDPASLPKAIMLQFNDGSWDHRAVWGDVDAIEYGAKGTPGKVHQGSLPEAGKWVRLEVDAAALGLHAGTVVRGFAFTQSGGTVYWDKAGVAGENNPALLPENRLSRLDLAEWICSPDNPLTARAVMNRLWKEFFGRGLSIAVEDLGGQGDPPSHPELLDWLADEFRSGGWDMKHMIRTVVMSAAYRQSSNLRPEMMESDPLNRLLSSQNPRRLDAEFVRDNALAIAGILNTDLGGPSAKPYQPPGYYAQIQFPDRDYVAHTDDRQWRRGLYMHWQRTFLHPMLANFDAPAREEGVCARPVSNTPQQALTLLNDPTFVEAARLFALRILPAGDDTARIQQAMQLALARPASARELESLAKFLATQREAFKAAPEDAKKYNAIGLKPVPDGVDPVELAAWSSVCRVVLNLHETITRY